MGVLGSVVKPRRGSESSGVEARLDKAPDVRGDVGEDGLEPDSGGGMYGDVTPRKVAVVLLLEEGRLEVADVGLEGREASGVVVLLCECSLWSPWSCLSLRI